MRARGETAANGDAKDDPYKPDPSHADDESPPASKPFALRRDLLVTDQDRYARDRGWAAFSASTR